MKLSIIALVATLVGVQAGCWCSDGYKYSEHYTMKACRKFGKHYLTSKPDGPECPRQAVSSESDWNEVKM
ncbi:hypothetical protein CGRA01v4_14033 [Colletotrichum graminicola]|nr:hypothetical protein CGRA01v4_14033 [Colletotrichum graminicola]